MVVPERERKAPPLRGVPILVGVAVRRQSGALNQTVEERKVDSTDRKRTSMVVVRASTRPPRLTAAAIMATSSALMLPSILPSMVVPVTIVDYNDDCSAGKAG